MIKTVTFNSLTPYKHIVILGSVHGDEKCGTKAINRFILDLENNNIVLNKGKVTFIPICNPKAYDENKRFVDRNLNRSLYIKENPNHYEDFIDPILCPILQRADIVLDLHSYASKGDEFGFLGTSCKEEIEFSLSLGISNFIYGWSEAFGKSKLKDTKEHLGTTEYTRENGGIAVTVECGNHNNKNAPDIAFRTICYALQNLGMIDNIYENSSQEHNFVKMKDVFLKEKTGKILKDKHYDEVAKGDVIAIYDDGETITSPYDGVVILPKTFANISKEWFYLGQKTLCPDADI